MNILFGLISFLIGAFILFLVLRPKLKIYQEKNEEIFKANNEAEVKLSILKEHIQIAEQQIEKEKDEWDKLKQNNFLLAEEIRNQSEKAESDAKNYYEKMINLYTERLNQDIQFLEQSFEESEKSYKEEYLKTINESANEYKDKIGLIRNEYLELNNELERMRSAVSSAVEERKRAEEMKDKENFYKIQLSSQDIKEIEKIREIIPYLSQAEPINKVIWSVYYKNPTSDMIGRVLGSEQKTGIYKITNLDNGMSYVGQAVN